MTATNITILDTGFIKPTHTGTQVATTLRSNSGVAFTIKANSIVPNSTLLGQANPELSSLTTPESNVGSQEASNIRIQGVLNADNSADRALFMALWNLPRTYGYKAVFYNVDTTATDTGTNSTRKRDHQLVTMLANSHVDTTEPQGDISMSGIIWTNTAYGSAKDLTDVYHIHVFFRSFTPNQSGGKNLISWELTGLMLPNGP